MSEHTITTTPEPAFFEHIHIGAGNFGLGMVVDVCHRAGLKSAVVNRDSRREYHKFLKSLGSYTLLLDDGPKTLSPKFYYYKPEDEASIIDLVSNPTVALVTTSVRKDSLSTIAPLLARGLAMRLEKNAVRQSLCILACENLVDNSIVLRKHVESHLPQNLRQHLLAEVFFCNTLVDRICAPISCASGKVQIPAESFHLWIVQVPEKKIEILNSLEHLGLMKLATSESEFRAHETQKYWCMNGVHLAAAAYAFNYNNYLKHFSQVLANPDIATKIKLLQMELLGAFSVYVKNMGIAELFPTKEVKTYNDQVFQRLRRNNKDTIARVLKLESGADAIVELLDRMERLLKPQCTLLGKRKGLVRPKDEAIALHPNTPASQKRLELDDALQQVLIALRSFGRVYEEATI